MLSHNNKYVDDPVEYNREINEFRARATPGSHGCISTRACEGCGLLVSDSICLCVGRFTCPKCGYEQGKDMYVAGRGLKPLVKYWWIDSSVFEYGAGI